MKRIIGIGNALVDVLTLINDDQILERFSLPKGSMTLVDGDLSRLIKAETSSLKSTLLSGGSAANTIHGLAMLGIETGFIGSVGKDETGDFFERDMKDAGVRTMLLRRDSPTGTAVALISRDSERTFGTHLGAAVELDAGDLSPEMFEGYDILYLEGYLIYNLDLVETACRMAKVAGMTVALDLASYNVVEANLNAFRKIIERYTDILFANAEEAKAYTGLEPEEALEYFSGSVKTAVVKVGAEGSWLKRGEEKLKVAALPVGCRDTTGAGDLYASGFLYGYAHGADMERSGVIGSLLAGRVIEIVGARLDETTFSEVKKQLEVL
ncbi:MAG: adenosine kinase [Bacteroidales bacterium]|nr:adenosine kinase [Bacteroidales bacterium]